MSCEVERKYINIVQIDLSFQRVFRGSLRSWAGLCEIVVDKVAAKQAFSPSTSVSPVRTTPPVFHAPLEAETTVNRKTG